MKHHLPVALIIALALTTACGGSDESSGDGAATSGPAPDAARLPDAAAEQAISDDDMFPDVIDATAQRTDDTWTISATLSSPYDTPERYADAWRVLGSDGEVYAERILTHDHANEQPFTRSKSGVEIPAGVSVIVIEGRDLEFGYGGDTFELTLPR